MYLAELALDMAAKVLNGGGGALMKVFQGAGFQELIQDAVSSFRQGEAGQARSFPCPQS
jgi:23S rRNA (uridine2552-2'-O)-methyltransferase